MRHDFAVLLLLSSLIATPLITAQQNSCLDVAEEPHHHLVFQNDAARVYILELPRLEATKMHCHTHSFLMVAAVDGETSRAKPGQAGISHAWRAGEARFVYAPITHTVENQLGSPYRELIVESLRTVSYDPLVTSYDTDDFPGDPGDTMPSWNVGFTRGAITAVKSQLAAGAATNLNDPDHVLLALSDVELKIETKAEAAKTLKLAAQEVVAIPGGSAHTVTNTGANSAKFVTVEF
jgi:hypothetical protein